jgi:hypothetical protein
MPERLPMLAIEDPIRAYANFICAAEGPVRPVWPHVVNWIFVMPDEAAASEAALAAAASEAALAAAASDAALAAAC